MMSSTFLGGVFVFSRNSFTSSMNLFSVAKPYVFSPYCLTSTAFWASFNGSRDSNFSSLVVFSSGLRNSASS